MVATVEIISRIPDQAFLEICEDAALKGVSVMKLAKQMNTTRYYISRRRKELNFAQWFEKKHGRSPKSVSRELSISMGKRNPHSKPKKIDFQSALQKKMNDPKFLDALYKNIAAKSLGELR